MFKPNATMIAMTADDATMTEISWNHDFPSKIHFRGFWNNKYLKDYLTHEGANLHMTSVLVYLLTY